LLLQNDLLAFGSIFSEITTIACFLLANPPARVRPDTFAFCTECESWWRAKSSRNCPETARVQNRYFSKGFQWKIDGFPIPGRSRPGPALEIDAFLKVFN